MAIYARRNLYPGINPHLNSALQQPGGEWASFHSAHINDLTDYLNDILPETHYAISERSLQIATYDSLQTHISRSRADVMIRRQGQMQPQHLNTSHSLAPTLTLSTIADLVIDMDEETLMSVVLRRATDDQPVSRIELLSPANKPPGSHFGTYFEKRSQTLVSGIAIVELDYLHQQRPTLPRVPSYADGEAGAYPYHTVVISPYPTLRDSETYVYSFGILDPVPAVPIPLATQINLNTDFGVAYQHTANKRQFTISLDYAQEPVNFGTYSAADQQTIRQFMQHIAQQQP